MSGDCLSLCSSLKRWLGVFLAVLLGVGLTACGDDGPLHEHNCSDGVDNDTDGRVDCEDSNCWGTPECPDRECGDNVADDDEACDGADLRDRTCLDLGYDGGTLGCDADCDLVVTGCIGDAVCGNGIIDGAEQCDGAALGDGTCSDFGFTSGAVTCDASCMVDTSDCEGRLLPECYDYGDLSGGVDGTLTCASEVGVMQWDWYTVQVSAGDCIDIVVDNGAGAADLLALAKDADGLTTYGLAEDFTQLDDELTCSETPWSEWACPAATVEALTSGTFYIYVAQWYEETGTNPGVDTCVTGSSEYSLFVAVNGDATSVTLVQDDQPL